jgi:hypothetical protein
MLRRAYNYKAEPKPLPKEKKSNWNGKVEVWTEPQKPKQEKIIKYEVDTDKLLDEIADENKKTISEIAEKLNAEPSREQSDEEDLQKLDSTEVEETQSIDEAEIPDQDQELETDGTEEADTESIEQQMDPEELQIETKDTMDDPTFTDPAFWERLENELSDELEQIEPDMEAPPEEDCY